MAFSVSFKGIDTEPKLILIPKNKTRAKNNKTKGTLYLLLLSKLVQWLKKEKFMFWKEIWMKNMY